MKETPEARRARYKVYYEANRDEILRRGREYRARNKDLIRAQAAARRATPRVKEQRRAYAKTYYATHPDSARAANRKWQAAHQEQYRAYQKKYREAHKRPSVPRKAVDPEVMKARQAGYNRKYYRANRDRMLAQANAWYRANPIIGINGEAVRITALPAELQPVALLIVETRRELRKRGTTT